MNRIYTLFKSNKTQRVIYFLILLLWIFVGVDHIKFKDDSSLFRFDIVYALIIPSILLIAPIISNKRPSWIGAFGIAVFHLIFTTQKIVNEYLLNFNKNSISNSFWIPTSSRVSIILILISLFITCIIWMMKPPK